MRDDRKTTKSQLVVLIIDTDLESRKRLAALIEEQFDIRLCIEVARIADALRLIETRPPDLIITDIALSDINGVEAVALLRKADPSVPILVYSSVGEAIFAELALGNRANSYLGKEERPSRGADAIQQVLKGKIWLTAAVAQRVHRKMGCEPIALAGGSR